MPLWQKLIAGCPDPIRARHFLKQLESASGGAAVRKLAHEPARILVALFSGSQALSESLLANPGWIETSLDPERLRFPRQKQGLQRELKSRVQSLRERREYPQAFAELRQFKQREILRIAARDLARMGDVPEITRELSDLADVCLDQVYQLCRTQLIERFGVPHHQDPAERWHPTTFAILGMGKLGGQELNYSSDVDVLFVYSEEGFCFKESPENSKPSARGLSNHQFFTRLGEAFIAEVGRLTPEGHLYRIDLRLRPEGTGGPLARSLASYENFYAQWGQTWERMMLIKTRGVAGDQTVAAEFLEMIQPFRYPRSLGERAIQEIAAMKQRIEREVVKSGELDRNVKLGRGGIREIEFVVQSLQLLNGGRLPFLQSPQTLPALAKLADYRLLPDKDAAVLATGYCFLREIEHRLQMENNRQTHTIPADPKARLRLARLMGFRTLAEFEKKHRERAENIRAIYDQFLRVDAPAGQLSRDFQGADLDWKRTLRRHAFRDPDKAFSLVKAFVQGPGYLHVSPRTADLGSDLIGRLLQLCPKLELTPAGIPVDPQATIQKTGPATKILSDPDRVLARLDSFVQAYGSRAMLYELWTSNLSLFELLLLLFDRSEFLAEVAIRTPDLVDELELSGRLRRRKTSAEILTDLRHGREDQDQRLWLRRYHQAELMRIGLRDILGLADFEQNSAELSALADACLQYALEAVLRRARIKTAPFAVIGLGKLGGAELSYGSDLDLIFVADSKTKNLARLPKLAAEVMDMLSGVTEFGVAFKTDARLRPDGEKGLLVNTLDRYEEYYRKRAMLWEIQALTRIRPIAGDSKAGRQFQELAATLTNFQKAPRGLAAFTPEWKQEIAKMRLRIEKERTPAGKQDAAIKTGAGGLMDAEFIAQTFCLERGWQEPNTLRVLEKIKAENVLDAPPAEQLIENFRRLQRIEGILRRWSYEGEVLLPDDPAPLYRVAVRCGFGNATEFMNAVRYHRKKVREVYDMLVGRLAPRE